jgi:hypothetical protein
VSKRRRERARDRREAAKERQVAARERAGGMDERGDDIGARRHRHAAEAHARVAAAAETLRVADVALEGARSGCGDHGSARRARWPAASRLTTRRSRHGTPTPRRAPHSSKRAGDPARLPGPRGLRAR